MMEILDYIKRSTSAFHAVKTAEDILSAEGFCKLSLADDNWRLETCGKYYINVYDSTLIAFKPHNKLREGLRIAISHTDFPCFKVKPQAVVTQDGYGKLNVEVYGGMILATWLDRPLSLAGKVVLKGKSAFTPEAHLVDFHRPLVTIPSLAIHMNRNVNEGQALNRQKELLPLAFMDAENADAEQLKQLLAEELNCSVTDILAYELNLYQTEEGCYCGFNREFISSPRLDNLTSVKASLTGLLKGTREQGLDVAVLFDNEEVGSRTKQGGASAILLNILERIYAGYKYTKAELLADMHHAQSMMLSMDVAHALHPNYPEKNDLTNKPVLNGGVALKMAASQSYAGDAEAVAIIRTLCAEHGIPCQNYVNNSNIPGGSTIGSLASALIPIRTMDVGIPILAMHSAREMMGSKDQEALDNLATVFFSK